jgi:nitroreductase/NAD-dependent dihydropyrimidine dehydrogenase PreA subunit
MHHKDEADVLNFIVDDKRCIRCGNCAKDCIAEIIEQKGKALPGIKPGQEGNCLQCQHCLAVCPAAAISILGRNPADSLELKAGGMPPLSQMTTLIRGRRSIRHYRNENVEPVLLKNLLATVANAPTGVNRRDLTFTVIDDKASMEKFRDKAMQELRQAIKDGRVAESAGYLLEAVPAWFERKHDIIFRGAPHLLIVSAPQDAPCPQEDIVIALAYFELIAQSAGLGTVWCGLVKWLLEALPELKPVLGLQVDHKYYCMLFGVPAIRFARTVQRDDAAAIRRVTL